MSATKKRKSESRLGVARQLPAEDISAGDYVAISQIAWQVPSFFWCHSDPAVMPPEEPVTMVFLPGNEVECLKVKSTCLPFVLCELSDGTRQIHDVRQVQFVRLDSGFARIARKSVQREQESMTRKRRKNKGKRK